MSSILPILVCSLEQHYFLLEVLSHCLIWQISALDSAFVGLLVQLTEAKLGARSLAVAVHLVLGVGVQETVLALLDYLYAVVVVVLGEILVEVVAIVFHP